MCVDVVVSRSSVMSIMTILHHDDESALLRYLPSFVSTFSIMPSFTNNGTCSAQLEFAIVVQATLR